MVNDEADARNLNWLYEKSLERTAQFEVTTVNLRLVQDEDKNIIPAVSSPSAIIVAICATEVFKLPTSCYLPLNNCLAFNYAYDIHWYTYEAQRKEDCLPCGQDTQRVCFLPSNSPNKTKFGS